MHIEPHATSAFELLRNISMLTVLCEFTTTVYSRQHNHNMFFKKQNATEPEVVTSGFVFFSFFFSPFRRIVYNHIVQYKHWECVFLLVRDWNVNG